MVDNYSFVDNILAGSAKPYQIEDLEAFEEDGITHVISLTPGMPLVSKYYEGNLLEFHHYPVFGTPDEQQLDDFIHLMAQLRKENSKAVVQSYRSKIPGQVLSKRIMLRNSFISDMESDHRYGKSCLFFLSMVDD